jgi:hypothetical protein
LAVQSATIAMIGSAASLALPSIHVPDAPSTAERTCSDTPRSRASSTASVAGLGHPAAHIASISSKWTCESMRASAASRGSAVYTPATSV